MKISGFFRSLLGKIIIAIILGIAASFVFPDWLARIFVTFNSLFGNFLNFFVPVLIFALITPAIAGLGRGAGKWLAITTGIAYGSAMIAGLIAYAVALNLFPLFIGDDGVNEVAEISEGNLEAYFSVEMPPPFEVMTALMLAFAIGLAMTVVKSDSLYVASRELEGVIMKVIESFVIPLLPVFIFGMFLSLGKNGNLVDTLVTFSQVLLVAVVLTIIYLLVQYLIAGAMVGKNPLSALRAMAPAYFTALGTSSSAATIPVTLKCAMNNGVRKDIGGFVVPLCATIHLSGSMIKIVLFSFAIIMMSGMEVSFGLAIGYILMLGVTMIAAPGVPGGAIMAASGLLASMLGFDESMVALMIAAYIAIDSFGTAANVTGDGAIAMIINKYAQDIGTRGDDATAADALSEDATV
ncbi:dicarboxylate/amino acid:cation symporter [Corynebacterium uterequi]|uniref:Na+/H+ dicarboxylate symporter n=1 Tax=Corynebacterium uterequi TaxID=1072256 RepID=A0A0G3HHD4_9CORY|nr:dicarboxylate/amino acid:cation symporter [Corynebacterium uterequi]AKK12165.1 Na+/H+ dicarboxylate symporter [Corynebacterium uterequi]